MGTSYYRLKQTDYDGKFSYSQIEAVNFEEKVNFAVYPNPVENMLNISYPICKGCTIQVYAANGQIVYEGTEQHINTENWAKGVYELIVIDAQKMLVDKVRVVR